MSSSGCLSCDSSSGSSAVVDSCPAQHISQAAAADPEVSAAVNDGAPADGAAGSSHQLALNHMTTPASTRAPYTSSSFAPSTSPSSSSIMLDGARLLCPSSTYQRHQGHQRHQRHQRPQRPTRTMQEGHDSGLRSVKKAHTGLSCLLGLGLLALSSLRVVDGGEVMEVTKDVQVPFNMNLTNPFHPSSSLSFAHVLFVGFSLTYADSAHLRGYIAQDVAQVGRYYAKTKFGCITSCDSSDFNGIDGILGLGMPNAALASIPEPLFFAISDETGDPANQYILNRRIFTIVSTDDAAELHLGGYDHNAISQDMKYIRTTSNVEYSVSVSSISMNGQEFLNFDSAAQASGKTSLPGILDSGTSCLVVPDSTLNGLFVEKPYSSLMDNLKRGYPIYITIGGHQFEIPFHNWWLYPNEEPCIQPAPDGFNGVLLGDVIFRALAVMFDLTHPQAPVVGLAPRNLNYQLVVEGCSHVNDFKGCVDFAVDDRGRKGVKLPVAKKHIKKHKSKNQGLLEIDWLQKKAMGGAERNGDGVPDLSPTGGDKLLTKVPVDFYQQTQYFVNLSVGTPRQTRTVIMDTGSSVFALFCDAPPKKETGAKSHIYLPHFIPFKPHLLQIHQSFTEAGGLSFWSNYFFGPQPSDTTLLYSVAAVLGSGVGLLMAVRYRRTVLSPSGAHPLTLSTAQTSPMDWEA